MTTETDRELLELAAKAAGVFLTRETMAAGWPEAEWCDTDEPAHDADGLRGTVFWYDKDGELGGTEKLLWSSLADDGDFFRMIALFRPQFGRSDDVELGREFVWVTLQPGAKEYTGHAYLKDSLTEAFRRAGTKAMALIGKNMPATQGEVKA